LGAAYLGIGDYDKATDLSLELLAEYPDNIDLTLKAYGNLIKYSREEGKTRDVDRYINDVQRYARSLIRKGKDEEYPLLYVATYDHGWLHGRGERMGERIGAVVTKASNILGISAYYHDSAAALLKDGEVAAAVQQERFSRKKHDAAFPAAHQVRATA
jgi:hypothetical protein